jgi:cell wall assembly regulator SMI1
MAKKKAPTGSVRSIRDSWKTIRTWIANNLPENESRFDRGASAKTVRELSNNLGRKLPDDFAESLRCHTVADGVIPSPAKHWTDMAYSLMTPDSILYTWGMILELIDSGTFDREHQRVKSSKGVVQQWFAPYWIPFADDGGGDYYCLDLCPTYPGNIGQIIWVPHDSPVRPRIAGSMSEFLSLLADNFESGNYRYEQRGDFGYGICRIDVKSFPRSELR